GAGPARRAPDRSTPVLVRLADVPCPGPAVRFDYQSIDTAARRLYISHMNAGELIAFNLATRKIEGTVGDLPRVTGVLAVPALGTFWSPCKRATRWRRSIPGPTR